MHRLRASWRSSLVTSTFLEHRRETGFSFELPSAVEARIYFLPYTRTRFSKGLKLFSPASATGLPKTSWLFSSQSLGTFQCSEILASMSGL